MMRRTPMRRTGWARKPKQQAATGGADKTAKTLSPATRRASMPLATACAPAIAKAEPVRSEAYRRLVAALPCVMCGVHGYSQAAHPNTGKGMGSKTDDREIFPLCASRPGVAGCHSKFDQSAIFKKHDRRAIEEEWGRITRAAIVAAGLWPSKLQHYKEQ